MSWNYRVIRSPLEATSLGIHEVYYDEEGRPSSWTEEPCGAVGDNLLELRAEVQYMMEAFERPVLRIVDGNKLEEET